VTNPPDEDAYEAIKERLSDHNLTEFQRVEKIHAMEALGGRKPSELLHEMLELCPSFHEASPFFLFLILQRLPSYLRIMFPSSLFSCPPLFTRHQLSFFSVQLSCSLH
jgi:hypothetical protein